MYLLTSAMGLFGTNLYDFLLRVVGSEILRTVASFIIRSALTRIGLLEEVLIVSPLVVNEYVGMGLSEYELVILHPPLL